MFCKSFFRALLGAILVFSSLLYAADPVDINRADAAALAEALSGVGETKAAEIVRYRQQHGPFRSADQLAEVRGIGAALVARNRDRILVSSDQ